MVGEAALRTPLDNAFTLRRHSGPTSEGIEFVMATAVLSIESRRAARDIVSFRAPFDMPNGGRATALFVDISPFGFMSRTAAELQTGDIVTVKLPFVGARAARIVWSLGGRIGGEFLEPIIPPSYARMLACAPNDRPNWNEI